MDAHRDESADVYRKHDAVVAARDDVADGVAAEDGDAPLVEPWQATGVESGESDAHRIPSAFCLAHRGAAGANHQHVAFFDVNLLRFLGGVEIVWQDLLALLHPFDRFLARNIDPAAV